MIINIMIMYSSVSESIYLSLFILQVYTYIIYAYTFWIMLCVHVLSGSSLTVSPGIDVAASGAAIVRPRSIKSPHLITKGKKKRKREKEVEEEQKKQIQSKNCRNRDAIEKILEICRGSWKLIARRLKLTFSHNFERTL